jgi:hypothetical protein
MRAWPSDGQLSRRYLTIVAADKALFGCGFTAMVVVCLQLNLGVRWLHVLAQEALMTAPQFLPEDSRLKAAAVAFALVRFESEAAQADRFRHPSSAPRFGEDAYVFLPSLRRIRSGDVVSFLAGLPSPALLAPTTMRGIVALTLLAELSGERATGARKIFTNQCAAVEESAQQLGATPETQVLISISGETHIVSFETVRVWSQLFAVQVGWSIAPFAGDPRVAARLCLIRSDGAKSCFGADRR